jgi:hypothetical protein
LAVGDEDVRLQHLKQSQIDAARLGPQGVVLAQRAGFKILLDVADELDLPFVGMATATPYDRAPAQRPQEIINSNRARHSLLQRISQP